MTQLSKAQFTTTYADPAGTFADNTSRDISAGDMQQFSEDIKDSVQFKLNDSITKAIVTVSSAQLLTLGSVPVTIIAAPGANKFLAIHRIFTSYNYNSVAYDFGVGDSPSFKWTSIFAGFEISYADINLSGDFNIYLENYSVSGSYNLKIPTNQALMLTTLSNGDPTVGDGDLDVIIYYSIEDINL